VTAQIRVLWVLRIYGPCSMAFVVEQTGLTRPQSLTAMGSLRRQNYAALYGPAEYDVTEKGRGYLAELSAQQNMEI
jgi:hypothetical protein